MNSTALLPSNDLNTPTAETFAPHREPERGRAHSPADRAVFTGNQSRLRRLPLQRRIAIGAVTDPLEAEADRVADHVTRPSAAHDPDPSRQSAAALTHAPAQLHRKCSHCEEEDQTLSRKCAHCEEEERTRGEARDARGEGQNTRLDTKSADPAASATGDAPAIVHDVLRSPGQPLDPVTRSFFEPRFGQDFSGVRVHTGPHAARSARAVNALAYTVGPHIAFAEGQFSPNAPAGRHLLAHELAHVVQQSGAAGPPPGPAHEADAEHAATRAAAGQTASVHAASAPGLARQPPHPALSQPLSWDELFHNVISDQRAFLFTGPADVAHPAVDPAGVGRGVGPDRTLRGTEVIAAIQVLDKDGNRVAIGFGAHRLLPGGHAEEQALAGLRNALPAGRDLHGGRMMVVVDQFPCGPDRHDCGLQLRDFARDNGLELEVRVPLRERVNQSGVNASPRTASRGAYRTDLAQEERLTAHLVTVDHQPAPPAPHGGGGGPRRGGGGGDDAAHDTTLHTPDVPHVDITGASRASRALSKEAQTLVFELENQTRSAVALTGRIRIYSSIFTHLLAAADVLDAISNAQTMMADGTLFGDTQKLAEQIANRSEEAKTDAEAIDDSFSLFGASGQIDAAIKAQDDDTLEALSGNLEQFAEAVSPTVDQFGVYARDLTARADAIAKIRDFFKKAVDIPQGEGTFANADEFEMYQSFEKLHSPVFRAGENYTYANGLLSIKRDGAFYLAHKANIAYWGIRLNRIATEVNRRAAAQPPPPPPDHASQTHAPFTQATTTPRGQPCTDCHTTNYRQQPSALKGPLSNLPDPTPDELLKSYYGTDKDK